MLAAFEDHPLHWLLAALILTGLGLWAVSFIRDTILDVLRVVRKVSDLRPTHRGTTRPMPPSGPQSQGPTP